MRVAWTVEPATPVYKQNHFTLDFGEALDPRALPLKLWWTAVILSLHSHWNLLRPCQVILPVAISDGEIEFWSRLLDQERVTLEKYRGGDDFERTVEIVCDGPRLEEFTLPPPVNRFATAFSGGKDSLLQAAILCEFTERPLLVNTYSPMPPLIDHDWFYRDRAMKEISARRDVELVVVKSDLRSIWPHYEIPHTLGYKISMGQITDPFFYTANMLAVAASRGIRHLTLAAETEYYRFERYHGRVAVNDYDFTYSLPIMCALDRALSRWGMSYSSLLIVFGSLQIMQLIRHRYRDLADLQISCFWVIKESEQYCSGCNKCFRVAMMLLALDDDPASLGIRLDALFEVYKDYDPGSDILSGVDASHAASRINLRKARRFFPTQNVWQRLGLQDSDSFRILKEIVRRGAPHAQAWLHKTHPAFLKFIPAPLRSQLESLSLEYWPELDSDDRAEDMALIDLTANWITQPLFQNQ